jgi:Family of unknown function (DUF5372)
MTVTTATMAMVRRHRDPLDGQQVRVLGRLRRHGQAELLVVLPDGSKRMIPQTWTDAEPTGETDAAATLGALGDLLAACVLVSALATSKQEQAARQSPCKEDSRATCPAQSAAATVSGATPDRVGSPARARDRRSDPAVGRSDRPSGHRPERGQQ